MMAWTNTFNEDPPASPWIAESMRLTAIYPEAAQVAAQPIWQPTTGMEPENQNSQPRKLFYENGTWRGRKLEVVSAETRLDWNYTAIQPAPAPSNPSAPPSVPLAPRPVFMGDFLSVMEDFSQVAASWLAIATRPMHRIALGLALVQPINDRPTGYALMGRYLPSVQLDGANSRDFIYQINRPRTVNIGGRQITINRLLVWNSVIYMGAEMNVNLSGTRATSQALEPLDQVIRVQMDLNTSAEFEGTIDSPTACEIFEVMRGYAVEIGERGDIP